MQRRVGKVKCFNKEMIYDCTKNKNNIIVVELTNKLFYKHNYVSVRLVKELPEFYEYIKRQILNSSLTLIPGSFIYFEVRGYKICGLVNRYSFSDEKESIVKFTEWSLNNMIKYFGKDKQYISGFLFDGQDVLDKFVEKEKLNWDIYYE